MAETTTLTVLIAGRTYPLKVEKTEEDTVLHLVKTINERITSLQVQFQSKDKQDCIAMAFLEMALQNQKQETNGLNNQDLQRSLTGIQKAIDQLLA
jgi:cell division protein ZapA (FtsZ GTPase activity inhibitor)